MEQDLEKLGKLVEQDINSDDMHDRLDNATKILDHTLKLHSPPTVEEAEAAVPEILTQNFGQVKHVMVGKQFTQDFAGSHVKLWLYASKQDKTTLIEVLHYSWDLARLEHTYVPDLANVVGQLAAGAKSNDDIAAIFSCYENYEADIGDLKTWVLEWCAANTRQDMEQWAGPFRVGTGSEAMNYEARAARRQMNSAIQGNASNAIGQALGASLGGNPNTAGLASPFKSDSNSLIGKMKKALSNG